MKRRTFMITVLAAASTAPAAAQTPGPLTLNLTGTSADDVVSVLYANKAGLSRAAGLDPVYQHSNSGAAAIAAVMGGTADICKSSMGSAVAARGHNIDIKLVVGGSLFRSVNKPGGEVQLIVTNDSPLRTPRDFNGRTVGVPSLNDAISLAMRAWVDAGRGDSHSLSFVEIPASAAAAAVAQGRVAAALLPPPFGAAAVADGKMRSLGMIFTAIAPQFLESGWFASGAYAAKNRDVCLRFAKLVGQASRYLNAHNAEADELVAAFTGMSMDMILQSGRSYLATSTDAREVQPLIDVMAKYGYVDRRFDADDLLLK